MANKIKKLIISIFGDGFFGLDSCPDTQEEITNGYREYQKKHKKPEISTCNVSYAQRGSCMSSSGNVYIGSCASFSSGQNSVAIGHSTGLNMSCNDRFIESHFEN